VSEIFSLFAKSSISSMSLFVVDLIKLSSLKQGTTIARRVFFDIYKLSPLFYDSIKKGSRKMKKFILNADDLAKDKSVNKAVLEAYEHGLLKSASIMTNMEDYDDAINSVVKNCPKLSVGVHLNIIEGKSITKGLDMLCDNEGNFNNSYVSLLLKSYNKRFLSQLEQEFRAQIERAKKDINITHIDSHVHTHSIPNIFKLTAKLALEYNIPRIRTQEEKPYFIMGRQYKPINFVKVMLLNFFTIINRQVAKKYNLETNDFLIGVSYTGDMDSSTILEGLKKIKKGKTIEALIHPNLQSKEFFLTKDENLKKHIECMNYEITNYQ